MALVDVDEQPVAWREAGDPGAPTVVFLHGLGGGRTAWDPQLRTLGRDFHCVAWDMPGYGASAPVDAAEGLGFATVVAALGRFLDRVGADRAHLVGLSYGGMHAQHFALAHPDRVASLVLTGTSPAFGLDGTRPEAWIRSRLAPLDAGATLADIAPAVVAAIAAPGFSGAGYDASVAAFGRIPEEAFRAACRALPDHDLRPQLGAIVAPTSVLVGALDTETPPAYAQELADGIPGARLTVVDGAGHLLPAEAPDLFCELVADFLHEVTAERAEPVTEPVPAPPTRPHGGPT